MILGRLWYNKEEVAILLYFFFLTTQEKRARVVSAQKTEAKITHRKKKGGMLALGLQTGRILSHSLFFNKKNKITKMILKKMSKTYAQEKISSLRREVISINVTISPFSYSFLYSLDAISRKDSLNSINTTSIRIQVVM